MRWTPGGTSTDIEDRRGEGGGGFGGGGGLRLGLGGTLLLIILSIIFKVNLLSLFSGGGGVVEPSRPAASEANRDAGEAREVQFVSFVLDDAQSTWDRLLQIGRAHV